MILSEEEDLIEMHKTHVDEIINVEKTEMALISEVDKSGSDIEEYVSKLDQMLLKKLNMIAAIRKKVIDFHAHLQMEKKLQAIYHKKQNTQEYGDEDYPQQDSEGMIMGVGPGNSNITQNFTKIDGSNLLGGLGGDRGTLEEENVLMDD